MKITCLGTGSAFTMKNWQTNLLITENGKNLLIDAGSDIRFSLAEQKLSYKDIDAVYVTHLHADHIGGLEYLAFCNYFDPSCKEKISLIGNNEVIRDLWAHCLSGGLRSIQAKHMTLDEYFELEMIKRNHSFTWEGLKFQIVQSVHIVDEYSIVPSYGVIIETPAGKKVYITSDTQFAPNQIMDFYKLVDVVIHDCETMPYKSGVHANFLDLCSLPTDIKKKLVLVHYQDNVINNLEEWTKKATDNGFWGFAAKGQVIEL